MSNYDQWLLDEADKRQGYLEDQYDEDDIQNMIDLILDNPEDSIRACKIIWKQETELKESDLEDFVTELDLGEIVQLHNYTHTILWRRDRMEKNAKAFNDSIASFVEETKDSFKVLGEIYAMEASYLNELKGGKNEQ